MNPAFVEQRNPYLGVTPRPWLRLRFLDPKLYRSEDTEEGVKVVEMGIFVAGLWLVVLGVLSVLLRVIVFLFSDMRPEEVNIQIGHVEADV